jgi:uncharacterized protein (TIGR04255 family)
VTQRAYSAPPIIDAIIELRFEDALSDALRERASKKFAATYPLVELGTHQEIGVEIKPDGIAVRTTVQERITKRRSVDTPGVLQFGNHILGVATGAPYGGWPELFDRFCRDWGVAKKIWKYRRIVRIGVRYINRIDLERNESGLIEYERYLNLRINLPETFPPISNYELGFQSAIEEIKCGVSVRSGIAPPAVPGRVSFTLDVDVKRNLEVPQKDADVFELLAAMRKAKNDLFETFITDEARELFNAN